MRLSELAGDCGWNKGIRRPPGLAYPTTSIGIGRPAANRNSHDISVSAANLRTLKSLGLVQAAKYERREKGREKMNALECTSSLTLFLWLFHVHYTEDIHSQGQHINRKH